MQIDRVFFPTETLGYGKRISIWTIGCPRRCFNCSNPELWNADKSREISVSSLEKSIQPFYEKSDGITITGGDPFFQAEDLFALLTAIRSNYNKEILVFTGYKIEDLNMIGGYYKKSLSLIDILIDGEYIDSLNDNLGLRGSSNQRIHFLNSHYSYRYKDAEKNTRKSQVVNYNGKIISIGIPIKKK